MGLVCRQKSQERGQQVWSAAKALAELSIPPRTAFSQPERKIQLAALAPNRIDKLRALQDRMRHWTIMQSLEFLETRRNRKLKRHIARYVVLLLFGGGCTVAIWTCFSLFLCFLLVDGPKVPS